VRHYTSSSRSKRSQSFQLLMPRERRRHRKQPGNPGAVQLKSLAVGGSTTWSEIITLQKGSGSNNSFYFTGAKSGDFTLAPTSLTLQNLCSYLKTAIVLSTQMDLQTVLGGRGRRRSTPNTFHVVLARLWLDRPRRRGAEKELGLKRACAAPPQEVHLLVFLTAAKKFSVCSRL
jgi:hypothetical protein